VVQHQRLLEQRLREPQRAAGIARQQHALGQLGGLVDVGEAAQHCASLVVPT
jgi:hypothetical protein